MNTMSVPESVNLLMRRIEDEVAHRRQVSAPKSIITSRVVDSVVDHGAAELPGTEFAIIPPDPVHLNLLACDLSFAKVPFRPKADASYHLNDFLPYDDVEFVSAAYKAILKREVDEDGMQTYLGMLRDGASKAEILGRVRYSPEGRQRRARVDGLMLSYGLDTISRWPIIGKFVAIVVAVWNLPNVQRNQRRISNDLAFRLTQTDQRITKVTSTVYEALGTLEQSQNRLSGLTKSFAVRSALETAQHSITRTATVLESKPDRSDLEKLALEFRAAVSAMDQAMDVIRGTALSKADKGSVDALKWDSMAAIERAEAQWNERLEEIAAVKVDQSVLRAVQEESKISLKTEMDRAMDLLSGIAQAKADQGSVDVLKRELMGAVGQVRIQMLRALESKAERQETTALSNHLIGLLQQRPTKDEFDRITAAVAKVDDLIAVVRQTKADNNDLVLVRSAVEKEIRGAVDGIIWSVDALKRDSMAAIERAETHWNERVEQIAAMKVDQSALSAAQDESKTSLKAEMDRAMDLLNVIVQAKANQGSVDVLRHELIGAIKQVRIQMLQTLESKAERQETTALSNHLVGLLQQQPTKDEFERITAAVAKVDDKIAAVRQTKADNDDLVLLRSAVETEIRGAIDGLSAVMRSKVDQSTISGLQEKINGALGEMTHNAEAVRREFLDETREALELLKREKADQTATDTIKVETKAALERINVKLEDTLAPVFSRIHDLKHNVLDQGRRVGLLLEEARRRFPHPISPAQLGAMLAEEEHQLDAMYASFEDKFRGTRSDIRQRLEIYLPYIRGVQAGTGDAPVVDLGCGRGEWLELLYSQGLSAHGVDVNRVFLATCRELNLDVMEQDALSFLQQRKPNSIGAVTSFHLIEHLPHKKLISLIDETLRVLRPGGIVIFETPNPKNLVVSGCNFYLDPTHRRPLPPDLSRYLLEARGFCKVDILEIHPFASEFQITEGATEVRDALNQYLFSAQDYAVIARKTE